MDARWQDQPFNKHYYSSAFLDGVYRREKKGKNLAIKAGELFISISAPNINSDEYLAISGDSKALGEWSLDKAIPMNGINFPLWQVSIPLKGIEAEFEYKFVILKKDTNELVAWEKGDNRYFNYNLPSKKDAIVIEGLKFMNPMPNWRGAGVAIPVFSLRTEEDFGVGDFYDLYKMIDWAVETGQNFVQILPINDTTRSEERRVGKECRRVGRVGWCRVH